MAVQSGHARAPMRVANLAETAVYLVRAECGSDRKQHISKRSFGVFRCRLAGKLFDPQFPVPPEWESDEPPALRQIVRLPSAIPRGRGRAEEKFGLPQVQFGGCHGLRHRAPD